MIEIKKLNKTYLRHTANANHVLHDISLTLPETGFVCILGPSGCGKTSLLNAIGGLDRFDNGKITTGKTSVSRYGTIAYEKERNRSFSYIFQNYYLLENHSVAYNVYLGLHNLKLNHKEKLKRVRQALEAVDMDRYIRRKAGELSGGQQQRVAIARALARQPRVIFADEPTGNLDEENTRNICTLLRKVSRESLVIMVTHETRIAEFFADRIITLEDGRIVSDKDSWQRTALSLTGDGTLYTGEFQTQSWEAEGIHLRILRESEAAPLQLTVVAGKDKILLKLSDGRTVTTTGVEDAPVIVEGKRPALELEEIDALSQAQTALLHQTPPPQGRVGSGLKLGMQFREAWSFIKETGLRKTGLKLFLVLLTALVLYIAADLAYISNINPETFIFTDSHQLTVELQAGSVVRDVLNPLSQNQQEYKEWIQSSGLDVDFLPTVSTPLVFYQPLFIQMEELFIRFPAHSYAPLNRLDKTALIHGRMPQGHTEIVVDRQVLERLYDDEGILQSSIQDVTFFLGQEVNLDKKKLFFTIVGICDSGEPTVYMGKSAIAGVGNLGVQVVSLSELQAMYPGKYDSMSIPEGGCYVNTYTAGAIWKERIGSQYNHAKDRQYRVTGVVYCPDLAAHIVVNDEEIDKILMAMTASKFHLYCADKSAVLEFLRGGSELEKANYLEAIITDSYQESYDAYLANSLIQLDGRTIITATVLLLSLVMLYLLSRARTQHRIGMLAVYRLLGIPGRKLTCIFIIEAVITCITTATPVAALAWLVLQILGKIPALSIPLLLPLSLAGQVLLAICLYQILVSLLPLWKLLRLPPAQLAAKYDL